MVLRFATFELDEAARELRQNGRVVRLRAQPFDLLALLCKRPGQIVLRSDIQHRIWGDDVTVDFDQGINHNVRQIRAALGDNATTPRFVETVPGQGYRFLPEVRGIEEVTAAPPPRRRRFPWVAVPAAVLVAILALWAWRAPRAVDREPHTLAVLPFRVAAADERADHLAAALTHELIAGLGRRHAPRLTVIARTSIARYAGLDTPADVIGRELGADVLLEGTVRSEGDRVRVTVALVRARDHVQLWAETYDGRFGDTLALDGEVAAAVAEELSLPADRREPLAAMNPAVAEVVHAGRYLLLRGQVARAIEKLERAVAMAPELAPAHEALAAALSRVGRFAEARAAVIRAVTLDPELPAAHRLLGSMSFYGDWDPEAARRSFERAIALNPAFAEAHHDLATVHSAAGRHEEALAGIARALALDPLSPIVRSDTGWFAYFARRYDEAERGCAATLELEPGSDWAHRCLLLVHHLRRDPVRFAQAAMVDMMRRGAAPDVVARIAADGEAAYWRWDLAEMETRRPAHRQATDRAVSLMALGDEGGALAALEVAASAHRGWLLLFLGVDPMFDGVRDRPRFRAVKALIRPRPT